VIKKLLSNALLSVVMDKSAREKLAGRKGDSGKEADKKPTKAPKQADTTKNQRAAPRMDAAAQAEELARTIELALEDARQEAANPVRRKRPAQTDVPAQPAKAAPKQTAKPKARPMTPEREKLIQDAVRIHREKVKVLDELDPEAREKLAVMAMMMLDPDSLPGAGGGKASGGPVDDIGGARKPIKRRRP